MCVCSGVIKNLFVKAAEAGLMGVTGVSANLSLTVP